MTTQSIPVENKAPAARACSCAQPKCGRDALGPPIRKILAAVDHPQHPALKMALKLAGPLHAQVAVIHVFEPPAVISTESAVLYSEELSQQMALAKETLKIIEQEIPEQSRAFTCLREGTPSYEILASAQEWGADMIVMGTHRRGAVIRALLGSTSQNVVRSGKLPVVLVGDEETVAVTSHETTSTEK